MRAGFAVLRREANEGGFLRPIVQEVVEKYFDYGNPRCGFVLMIREVYEVGLILSPKCDGFAVLMFCMSAHR